MLASIVYASFLFSSNDIYVLLTYTARTFELFAASALL